MPSSLFIGRSTIDVASVVQTFPSEDEKVVAKQNYIQGGGSALNAAATYAHLGGHATLATSLGQRSPFLPLLLAEMRNLAVQMVDVCDEPDFLLPFSTIISTVATGSRLIVNSAQEECRHTRRLPDLFTADLSTIQLDQYERFFVAQHIDLIRTFTGPVVLDGGSWKDWSREFLDAVTIPVVSESFFPAGVAAFAVDCAARGVTQWAVTLGKKGLLFHDNGTSAHIDAEPVDAIDSLGAGDIFHGAFCYFVGSGRSFVDALHQASKIAARSCAFIGTRAWMENDA